MFVLHNLLPSREANELRVFSEQKEWVDVPFMGHLLSIRFLSGITIILREN